MLQLTNLNQNRSRVWLVGLLVVAVGALMAVGQENEPLKANLDNDSSEGDVETYTEDSSLAAGQFSVANLDPSGNFSSLRVGVSGGGDIFGWADVDGETAEVELFVSDPTLEAGMARVVDVNDDGDAEAIWIGTKGADFNQNGESDIEEYGSIVALADIDGNDDIEVIVLDTSRQLGRFLAAGFDINVRRDDRYEVIWIGVMNENGRSRAATFEGVADLDGDGDDEVIIRDIRLGSDSGFGSQAIDVDRDGDDDIVIRR